MKRYGMKKKTKTDFENELKDLRVERKRIDIQRRENDLAILKLELAIETLSN